MPEAKPTPAPLAGLVESLLRSLLAGPLPKAEAEAAMPALVRPGDIVAAVDALVAEAALRGSSLEPLKPAVAKLLNLLRRPLEAPAAPPTAARSGLSPSPVGRDPLSLLLLEENRLALAALELLRGPVARLSAANAPSGPAPADAVLRLREGLAALEPLELHYARLENVLFPYFEARHPKYRCLSLMWSIHDDVRRSLRSLSALAKEEGAAGPAAAAEIALAAGRLFFDVNALVFREERILFPVAFPLLEPAELLGLFGEALALGPGLLGPAQIEGLALRAEGYAAALADVGERAGDVGRGPGARAGASAEARSGAQARADAPTRDAAAAASAAPAAAPALPLDAGSLPLPVIDALLKSLPLDLTFIDAEGRVAYFSNGSARVFPRSPAVIGRDVRNCHPHESLGRVLGLIEDFREGRREREAFYIDLRGRFIHIEYFAIRGSGGEFLGVLEASEDLTGKRALSGEKRLASSGEGN